MWALDKRSFEERSQVPRQHTGAMPVVKFFGGPTPQSLWTSLGGESCPRHTCEVVPTLNNCRLMLVEGRVAPILCPMRSLGTP